MTTASLKLWNNIPYTEGCIVVPKLTSLSIPSEDPIASFEGLEISRSSMFSEVKVRASYEDLWNCNYLLIEFESNNGKDFSFYGWVDNVLCTSDSEGYPITTIQWHVDLWRTWANRVIFGSGIVKKRPHLGSAPPQEYSYRYLLPKTPREIISSDRIYWVYLNTSKTFEGITTTQYLAYPIASWNALQDYQLKLSGTLDEWKKCPTLQETLNGNFDELFNLDPDAIYSAFLSPVAPCSYTVSDYQVTMTGSWVGKTMTLDYAAAVPQYSPVYEAFSFTTMAETTDTTIYNITDFDRTPIGALPWGLAVNGGDYRVINSDISMYLSIRFTTADIPVEKSASAGLEFLIPLKTIPIGTNAKSSYLYSGQADYDRRVMDIQRVQSAQSGLAGIGNSAVQGAMAGGMLGAIGGPIGAAGGALIGGVSAAVGGTLSTISDYYISGVANDKMMDATLTQKAQQSSYLTQPSSGTDWLEYGALPQILPMQWDDYSITQRTQDIALYGAHVNEPMASCHNLIYEGGPLQIVNLEVTGEMPLQAREYIRNRFANGVVLK